MIVYPSSLPLPFVDYSGAPRNATLRSAGEQGYVFRRSRFDARYSELQIAWRLTPTEYGNLKSFFLTTLGNGAARFQIELRYPKNSSVSEWIVQFIGGFDAQYGDGIWSLSSNLDLLRPVQLPPVAGPIGTAGYHVASEEESGEYLLYTTTPDHPYYVHTS